MGEFQEVESTPKLISEIEPIEKSRSQMITTRKQIKKFVEPPLVPACEIFWDKNVETLSSSANRKDIGRAAYIILNFDTMSSKNQEIAQGLTSVIDYDGMKAVKITIPIEDDNVTVEEVKRKAVEVAEKFKKQKMTWAPVYTIEQLREIYAIDPNDQWYGVDAFTEEGLYYDKESQLFYLSREHFQKATEEFKE